MNKVVPHIDVALRRLQQRFARYYESVHGVAYPKELETIRMGSSKPPPPYGDTKQTDMPR